MRSLVIVPTFNEVENIERLLARVAETVPAADVLVVDDNSPDGTRDAVRRRMSESPRVHLLERPGKQGLAAAYGAGFAWGLARGYDALLQMDADFSHDPAALPALLAALDDGADLAMGSRYVPGGSTAGWSLLRRFISRGGNTYARLVLGLRYGDLTGGFCAWRRSTLEKIGFTDVRSKGYVFQVELKYRAHRAGLVIREIPIIFRERERGVSKMSGAIVGEAALTVLALRARPLLVPTGLPVPE